MTIFMYASLLILIQCINPFEGVEISIEQTTYTVIENRINREVCAVLLSDTQIPVSVTLTTMSGSATSTLKDKCPHLSNS